MTASAVPEGLLGAAAPPDVVRPQQDYALTQREAYRADSLALDAGTAALDFPHLI